MRPRNFAAALAVSTTVGFVGGRCSKPSISSHGSWNEPTITRAISAYEARVVKVVDGDTLMVALSNGTSTEEKVRLIAIDTPEKGQRWYAESHAALSELVVGKSVRLEFENSGKLQRDKYGRVLAYVFVDDLNANVEIVRRGWSAYVNKFGGEKYSRELIVAEDEARAARRGTWSSR